MESFDDLCASYTSCQFTHLICKSCDKYNKSDFTQTKCYCNDLICRKCNDNTVSCHICITYIDELTSKIQYKKLEDFFNMFIKDEIEKLIPVPVPTICSICGCGSEDYMIAYGYQCHCEQQEYYNNNYYDDDELIYNDDINYNDDHDDYNDFTF